jgi:hypothetical protein
MLSCSAWELLIAGLWILNACYILYCHPRKLYHCFFLIFLMPRCPRIIWTRRWIFIPPRNAQLFSLGIVICRSVDPECLLHALLQRLDCLGYPGLDQWGRIPWRILHHQALLQVEKTKLCHKKGKCLNKHYYLFKYHVSYISGNRLRTIHQEHFPR